MKTTTSLEPYIVALHSLMPKLKMLWPWFDNLGFLLYFCPCQQQIQNGPTYISLGKLYINPNFSAVDIEKLDWEDKCDLISKHPAACARFFNNWVNKFFKHILRSPFSPLRHLEYFFYRVEFQQRGSPHIHALL